MNSVAIKTLSTHENFGLFDQGILVTASRAGSKEYSYNVTSVVLLTEFTKLFAALFLFFFTGSNLLDFIGNCTPDGPIMNPRV